MFSCSMRLLYPSVGQCRQLDSSRRSALSLSAALGLFALLLLAACSDSTAPPPPKDIQSLVVISGAGQTAVVGAMFPSPIVVRVTDSLGHPSVGTVGISALAGQLTAPNSRVNVTVVTDARGTASFTMGAGGDAGSQDLSITVTGSNAPPNNMGGHVAWTQIVENATPGPFDHLDTLYPVQPFLFGESIDLVPVLKPVDSYGNATTLPTGGVLTVTPGQVVADTVIPPSSEYEGKLTIGLVAGAHSYADTISRFVSLRPAAAVSYKCIADASGPVTDFGASLDSAVVSGIVNGVYPKDALNYIIGQKSGIPEVPGIQMHFQGVIVRYRHDAVVDSMNVRQSDNFLQSVLEQRPDTLVLPLASNRPAGSQYAVLISANPRRYVGGSWCGPAWPIRTPVVLQQN